jgi:hypothetical protein
MKKKIILFVPIIALLAVGCNLSGQTSSQVPVPAENTNTTPTSSPAIVNYGSTPKMSYKIASQKVDQYNRPTEITIDLFANENKVGTVENTTTLPMGDVVFFAGNGQEQFFTIQQDGIGDGASKNTNVYKLNLQTGEVARLVSGSSTNGEVNFAQDFDITTDLLYLNYVTATIAKGSQSFDFTIHRLNTNTGIEQKISFAPSILIGTNFTISNARTSPDETKIAVLVEVPIPGNNDNRLYTSQVWIVNIQNEKAVVYEKSTTPGPQWTLLTGWKDNTTPQWKAK